MEMDRSTEGGETREGASPDPRTAGRPPAGPEGGVSFDLGDILRRARTLFAAAWQECLIVYWGAGAVSWLILFLLTATLASINVLAGDRELTPILEFLHFVGLFVIPAWIFWLGRNLALLKIARRQPVTPETLFHCGPQLLTFLLAAAIVASPCLIIYGLAEAVLAWRGEAPLASLVRLILASNPPVPAVGHEEQSLLLLAVIGLSYLTNFAVMIRLGQFPFIIIDRREDVLGSLLVSLRMTRGRTATVFLIYLAQLTINVAGLLVCCVGLFVTLPLTSLISAVTYNVLSREFPAAEGAEADATDVDLAT